MDHLNVDLTVEFQLPKDSLGARGPCGAQLEKELKMAGDKVKNAIGVFLLFTGGNNYLWFQQNYYNYQLEVTPNEIYDR